MNLMISQVLNANMVCLCVTGTCFCTHLQETYLCYAFGLNFIWTKSGIVEKHYEVLRHVCPKVFVD